MTLSKAMDIAEKFNDTIFTNTQEMVDAVCALINFADRWSFLSVKENGDEIDF